MKRLLALLLALSMVISLLPATVLAEEMPQEDAALTEQLEEPEGENEEDEPQEDPQGDAGEKSGEEEKEDPNEDSEGDSEETPQEEPKGDSEEDPKGDSEEDPQGDSEEKPQEDPMKDPEEEEEVSEEAALEGDGYSGDCGENLTWSFSQEMGTLNISGSGEMYDFKESAAPWAGLQVKDLNIAEGVTSIGSYAFQNMDLLTYLSLPDSLESIHEGAFSGSSLREIYLGSGLKSVGSSAFANTSITQVTLPAGMTEVDGNPFIGCSRLTEILVAEGNTGFRSIDGVLYSADGKTLYFGPAGKTGTLTVPDGVETIQDDAFYSGCITAVILPTSLTAIEENAFKGIGNLKVYYAGTDEEKNQISMANAFEESAQWFRGGTCGDNLTWSFDEATGILTVSGTGEMDTYEYDIDRRKNTAPWADLNVQALVVEEGVTSIGNYAFYDMTSLTAVTLNEGLASIGGAAFGSCDNMALNSDFPDSLQEIGDVAFFACYALTGELTFGSKLTRLDMRAFAYTGVTKVTLPEGLTAENYDPQAFMGCQSLKEILVSEENKNFRSIDGVLYSYDGKTLLSGPSGKTEKLTVPDGVETIKALAFYHGHIAEVSLPTTIKSVEEKAFQYSWVRQVQYAGNWADKDKIDLAADNDDLLNAQWHYATSGSCGEEVSWAYNESTKTLTVSGTGAMENYKTEDGETIKTPWYGFDIQKLQICEGVTAIGEMAFAGAGITVAVLPASMTSFNAQAFLGCEKLTAYEVAGGEAFEAVEGVLYSKDRKTLYAIPGGLTGRLTVLDGTETVASYAGAKSQITELVLPVSVKSLGSSAFAESKAKTVYYAGSEEDKENITMESDAFPERITWYCTKNGTTGDNLTWAYDALTQTLTIGGEGAMPDYNFMDRSAPWGPCQVDHLVIGEGITSIGENAFAMGMLLSGTLDLTETKVASIGKSAFRETNLTQVKLPAGLTECNFADAFADCAKLTEIEISPENESFASVDGVVYSKNGETLFYCPTGKTKSLTLPENTKTISAYAFLDSNITEIVLPASLETVEEGAFDGAKLTRVLYLGTEAQWEALILKIADGNETLINADRKTAESTDIGDGLTWTLANKVLTVTGEGKMDDYSTSFPAPWQGKTVNKLVVSEGVTYLGSYAFAGLAIKTVTLPESLESIGENTFAKTPKAIQLTYGGSAERWTYWLPKDNCGLSSPKVTAKGKNVSGDLTWSYNAKTKTLTFSGSGWTEGYSEEEFSQGQKPDWLAWGIPAEKLVFSGKEIGIGARTFYGMTGLKQVTLPQDMQGISDYAFAYSGLSGKLTIPAGTSIWSYAFRGTQITSLVLPEDAWVQDGNAFADCALLTDIYYSGNASVLKKRLGDYISPEVTIHGQKQYGGEVGINVCWSLDKQGTLTLSETDNTYSIVTDFESYADTPWAGLTVKKLVLVNVDIIGANAFNGCAGLTGDLTLENVYSVGENAFAGTGLKTLRIKQSTPKELLEMYLGWANSEYGTNFRLGIAESAFAGSKLTDVYYSFAESYLREQLGEGHPLLTKKLHCTYPYGGWDFRMEEMVYVQWIIDSKGVLRVTAKAIPDYEPLEAPWSAYKATSLALTGIEKIGKNAFYGMYGLTKLTIPSTVKTIGDQAFYGCIGITGTLTIPEGVTEIGNRAFGNLPKLTALKLPASLKSLATGAFDGCKGLKTVTFAGCMTELAKLDSYGYLRNMGAAITCQDSSTGKFTKCDASWTLDGKGILTVTGEGCLTLEYAERNMLTNLAVRKVVIKPGITEIGEGCFSGMNITEVSLPEGLTKLDRNAFAANTYLNKMTLPASLESLEYGSLNNHYLNTVTVAKGNKFLTVKGGVLYSKDMTRLLLVPNGVKKLTIPDSVTTVAKGALANNSLTTLVLGAGIGPTSLEGDEGLAGLTDCGDNNITSLTVSKKNQQLRAVGNVLFAGSTLVLYPYTRPGAEYRVPEGTTAIAKNAFGEYYFHYLKRLVLPASVEKVEDGGIYNYNLDLVVLGKDTEIGKGVGFRSIYCLKDSKAAEYAEGFNNRKYLEEENVTLHFDAAETGAAGMPKDITDVPPGGQVTVPKKAPTLKGYTFLGWQVQNGETVYQPGTVLTLAGNMTLVPLFRKNGLVQEGSCGKNTRWTLDKNGTLTISGQGTVGGGPSSRNPLTVKKLVIEEGVTSLDDRFFRYVTVKGQVTIPASMQKIGAQAFKDQTGITGVSFASSIQASGLQIGVGAFYGCTGIKGAVTLPAQLVAIDESAFDGCSGITALNTATTDTTGRYTSVDGVLYGENGQTLLLCPVGKTGSITIPTATKSIADGAFRNSKITKVYYQNGEANWKGIEGRANLPVYPTFAYEIQYSSNVKSPTSAEVTMSRPNPNSILSSQSITLKNPTMQGYIFQGWYNEAGKKVTKIAKGTKATVKLQARFTPITYTVAYNANGGKGKTPGTSVKYDTELTVAENKFTRTGYTFQGWNTAKNSTGKAYEPGNTPSNLTTKNKGTVTLYAQWKANSYTVHFNANVPEETEVTGAMDSQSFTYDKDQALTANTFARTGYTFTGWKTQNGKTVYKNKASVKNLTSTVNGEVTLYAQWAAKKITVVFHSNYPTAIKEKTVKQTVTCGKETKLAKNTFAAKGYTFAGWSETKDGEVKYTNTQSVSFLSDKAIDLYAVWTKNP